jgi:hypothetical protein
MTSPFLKKPTPAARAAAKKSATDAHPSPAAKRVSDKSHEVYGLMIDDLARSGLTAADAKAMRLVPYLRDEDPEIFPPGAGYRIPYFTREGAPRSDMYRYRFVEDTRKKGFGALGSAKSRRYTQPSGSPPGVYWPPFADWVRIAEDPSVQLVITEGEKKAAASSKLGVPCVGLGGVWSFRSKSLGTKLLPELATVEWGDRPVYIVYDSDAARNSQVCQAENALAEELTRQGAQVRIVRLPDGTDGSKMGLDDYLVARGADALVELCSATELFSMSSALHKMSSEVIYIRNPGIVMIRKDSQPLRPSDFVNHAYANWQYTRVSAAPNGTPKLETRQTAADWLKWPSRAAAKSIAFAPGEDEITTDGRYNVWKGWPHTPKRGSVRMWNELLDFLCKDSPIAREYVEKWFAYPIQNPGVKLRNAIVFWGSGKGTGKSLLGYTMGDLYGDAFYEIDDSHIENSTFNEWARNRHFVLGDEITGNSARRVANRIKTMITREKIEVNIKNIPQYTVNDCINYYFTAQHPDCFYLEEGDRRYFIHEVKTFRPLPQEFYREYDAWRRSAAGKSALMWHLLYAVDTSDFDPMAAPPVTSDKLAMIADTGTELELWLRDMRDNPNLFCAKFGDSDLVTLNEVTVLYEAEGNPKPSSVLVGRKLKVAGIPLLQPKDLSTPQVTVNNKLTRFYALRNAQKWAKATSDTLREEYARTRGGARKTKF